MKKIIATAALVAVTLGLAACDVEQTEEGEMPEIEGGNLPEYDVDTADVDVDMGTKQVEVPTMDVDVKGPNEGEADANAETE